MTKTLEEELRTERDMKFGILCALRDVLTQAERQLRKAAREYNVADKAYWDSVEKEKQLKEDTQ